ncbi:MAG: HAD family phosphatase [Candidatus Poseidoniia archaeon]|jgi:beta-phosphoglucomutase|nr:glycoprotease [Euryarchaeota archaeon]MDP6534411.1 HAD family phosphatase [Candidatus Poseidoniia archaeon]MDP6834562.1 HAD family phosphatase [Candidatus Poseidoniia archaeon]
MALRGVIFDLDGVIVDSSIFHFGAWQRWAREVGIIEDVDEEWFREHHGKRNDAIITATLGLISETELEAHATRKEEYFRELARGKLEPLPGVSTLVEELVSDEWGLAIGTSTPRENLDLVLNELPFSSAFTATACGSEVTHGKPAPDIFLRAAELLELPPERCVVVEDAPSGVAAARAGGFACLAVATTRPRELLSEANLLLDSLEEATLEVVENMLA